MALAFPGHPRVLRVTPWAPPGHPLGTPWAPPWAPPRHPRVLRVTLSLGCRAASGPRGCGAVRRRASDCRRCLSLLDWLCLCVLGPGAVVRLREGGVAQCPRSSACVRGLHGAALVKQGPWGARHGPLPQGWVCAQCEHYAGSAAAVGLGGSYPGANPICKCGEDGRTSSRVPVGVSRHISPQLRV